MYLAIMGQRLHGGNMAGNHFPRQVIWINLYADRVEKATVSASYEAVSYKTAPGLELAPVVCDLAL